MTADTRELTLQQALDNLKQAADKVDNQAHAERVASAKATDARNALTAAKKDLDAARLVVANKLERVGRG